MVVKHHQNRHKIHKRCTFISSSHNWKYFCKPTFIYVHIGQDGIIVLNLILSLTLYGSESPLKVKFNWAKPTHPFRVGCCTFLIHESIFFTRNWHERGSLLRELSLFFLHITPIKCYQKTLIFQWF